jgi:long-chain acyl-CoA synthetase
MISLPKGKKLSPPSVEDKLRFNRYIKDVVVFWRNSLMALIQLDFEAAGKWAERNNIPYSTVAQLSQTSPVYDLIGQAVQEVNQTLPEEAKVAGYFLLSKPLSADESELTRSGKLRRDFIIEKYCPRGKKDNQVSHQEKVGGTE